MRVRPRRGSPRLPVEPPGSSREAQLPSMPLTHSRHIGILQQRSEVGSAARLLLVRAEIVPFASRDRVTGWRRVYVWRSCIAPAVLSRFVLSTSRRCQPKTSHRSTARLPTSRQAAGADLPRLSRHARGGCRPSAGCGHVMLRDTRAFTDQRHLPGACIRPRPRSFIRCRRFVRSGTE